MKTLTYYIKTLGCQANEADSSTLAGILEALDINPISIDGQIFNNELEELEFVLPKVDVFIVNTCSVRQKSEDKVFGLGKTLKRVKELTGKVPFIVMSGCMVGSTTGERPRYAFEDLQKKTPWVNAYINPSQISSLPSILLENKLITEWAVKKLQLSEIEPKLDKLTHAFVNISYGCDNFCTFCVVPYARGREVSRSKADILRDIKRLINMGVHEITLCGQNVNSWGLNTVEKFEIRLGSDQKLPFADLLREIHALPEISKISFLSSNPFDFTTDLIDVLTLPKISNYLHIAIQSGNNDILKKMNRRHTIEDFYALIKKIIAAKPNVEFGTDIIVGFPTETRDQFMDTVKLVQNVKFNVAYIAMYSPRKGTPAEKYLKDDISRIEKKWRHDHLTRVWKQSLMKVS